MAATAGRKVRLKYSSNGGTTYTAIAGARTDNLTINREGIDITDKDDAGVRTMLAEVGVWSMDADLEGVLIDDTILALAADPTTSALFDFQVVVEGLGTFEGSWTLGNFSVSGQDGANPTTFTAAIASSGTITWTAA